jgi:hypothetical protein
LSFFITVCISSSVAISIGVPSFSEFSSISFCNFTNSSFSNSNYRGITVTNTFSTVIEGTCCILKERIEPKLLLSQNKLQRGFTQKASFLNTAVIFLF